MGMVWSQMTTWIRMSLLFATACYSCTADQTLHVRLMTPLSSQSSPDGTDFETVVTADWPSEGPVSIPAGSLVRGKVLRARPVGFGLRRERALLELGFAEYVLPDGTRQPLWASLKGVDNARESVRKGRISGIHAASGPAGWIQGLWIRPTTLLTPGGLAGVVGLSGLIGSKLALGPAGDAGLFLLKSIIFRLPKSEIHLPQGTDLQIAVSNLSAGHPEFASTPNTELDAKVREWIAQQPSEVTEPSGKPVLDRVNVALEGSLDEVVRAMAGAGWSPADGLSRESFGRAYKAFTNMSGYRTAPVSPIRYQKGMPDLVFQKSFNSMAKRHHIRLWYAGEQAGKQLWLGAASHDMTVSFKKWPITFTHHIDPRIDLERERVAEDLLFAGCAAPPAYVERPDLAMINQSNKAPTTDGRAVYLSVHECASPEEALDAAAQPHEPNGPFLKRLARRLILEARYHLVQGNIYYKGFQMLRGRNALFAD
jgi:hypothetical protein